MTPEHFDAGMAMLLTAFPHHRLTEVELKLLRTYLIGLEPTAFFRAVIEICATHRELYPGTNLVALILDYALPDGAPSAVEAWQQVRAELRRAGPYQQACLSHPRIAQAVQVIGWQTLCNSEQIGVERAHFLKAYDAFSQRDRRQRLLASVHPVVQRCVTEVARALGSSAPAPP